MAGSLVRFWWFRSYYAEGRAWLEGFLDLSGASGRTAVRAKALHALGTLIYWSADWAAGDGEVARSSLEESLEIYRKLGEEERIAAVLVDLGRLGTQMEEWEEARSSLMESLELERRSGNEHGIAVSRYCLGFLALLRGGHGAARDHLEESLEILQRIGDPEEVRICLWCLMMLACEQGDYATARARSAQMMEDTAVLQYRYAAPFVLMAYARLAAGEGQPARALRLAGAEAELRQTIGTSAGPALQAYLRRGLEPAWAALGEEAGKAAFEEGRALTLEGAIAYALEEAPPKEGQDTDLLAQATKANLAGGLSDRELEVLRLVSEGMTDAQVAERLFVSTRTVNAHLRSILRKLGARSRAAAARLAEKRGLLG